MLLVYSLRYRNFRVPVCTSAFSNLHNYIAIDLYNYIYNIKIKDVGQNHKNMWTRLGLYTNVGPIIWCMSDVQIGIAM